MQTRPHYDAALIAGLGAGAATIMSMIKDEKGFIR